MERKILPELYTVHYFLCLECIFLALVRTFQLKLSIVNDIMVGVDKFKVTQEASATGEGLGSPFKEPTFVGINQLYKTTIDRF